MVPFVSVLALGAVAWWVTQEGGFIEPPPLTEVSFETLHDGAQRVRLEGMAHYASTITQTVPGGLVSPERHYYVFGFFPKHDAASRAIPVLVRTSRPPERLVSFEVMTVEGRLGPIDTRLIPPSTEAMLSGKSEYWFADEVLLLRAERIESEDGVWVEP